MAYANSGRHLFKAGMALRASQHSISMMGTITYPIDEDSIPKRPFTSSIWDNMST